MIPDDIILEYNKYKALGFKAQIVKDNLNNKYFVSLFSISMSKSAGWYEVITFQALRSGGK